MNTTTATLPQRQPSDADAMQGLLQAVQQIAPVLREHAPRAEETRHLAPAVVQAMTRAGLFRLWLPRAFGGFELEPVGALRVVEAVAAIDSAAGWCAAVAASATPFLAMLPDAGVQTLFRDPPDPVFSGGLFPPGQAMAVEGGWRLNGRWAFHSGCQHSHWHLVSALVMDGAQPRVGSDGRPLQIIAAIPARQAGILDTWHTLGMRGTGSHDVVVSDLFVPEQHAAWLQPGQPRGAAFQGPLFGIGIWLAVVCLAPTALGVAHAALDTLLALAREKTPSYTQTTLQQRAVVQTQAARAEALLGAGRAYLHETVHAAWQQVAGGQALDLQHKVRLQLATTFAIRAAADAVDLIHEAAGTTAIREEHGLERHFRDVHVVTQHAFGSTARYESVGRLLFGLEPDWAFFAY
ncbi:acyl-CoA dehydrogenase family protein [Aquabacterium sp. A7-Y]|uniref:acyl-CoA dehydrogenase family protein n=1 Tax=Aquabacterium sp. A7-Y TaxID=1349605 RepID=UPI00223D437F|nr:acyl-CoA dehydrogenase family protein [Aquabacterium sp. A7-Y]MCW7539962.1 acyl-CoA dehydrogenase family protein [Aquabacterium sp. A7-Y]